MKKWLSLAAVVVLCLALVIGIACGGGDGEEEEAGVTKLKFGFGLPMTGATGAAVGVPAKYAFSMAAEKIGVFEVAGKQYRWDPIFEDNLFTVAGGTSSASKFIYEHHVDFMHQAGIDPGMAAVSFTEELGMLLDTAGGGWGAFGPDKPYFFQVAATWAMGYATFFDWLTKEYPEVQRVVMAYGDNELGYQQAEVIGVVAQYYGLDVKTASIPTGTVEYYPLATKLMTYDPDFALVGPATLGPMRDMGYEGRAMSAYWTIADAEISGWDICQGYLIIMPHPIQGLWPATDEVRVEYEEDYGLELTPAAYWALNVLFIYTQGLQQAGTVDDMDRIVEALETGTFDSLSGPVYFGLEELNGIGHLTVWPCPIYEVVGEDEYRVITVYTAEETEAITVEVFK